MGRWKENKHKNDRKKIQTKAEKAVGSSGKVKGKIEEKDGKRKQKERKRRKMIKTEKEKLFRLHLSIYLICL